MSLPDDPPTSSAPVVDGTDVTADPSALDTGADDRPATTDPEQLTDEGHLGGTGGSGGAG